MYPCKLPKLKYASWTTSLCLSTLQSIERLEIWEAQKQLKATYFTLGFCFVLPKVQPYHCPSRWEAESAMPGDFNEDRICWRNVSWVALSCFTWIFEKNNGIRSDWKPGDNMFSSSDRVSPIYPSGKQTRCLSLQHVYNVPDDLIQQSYKPWKSWFTMETLTGHQVQWYL